MGHVAAQRRFLRKRRALKPMSARPTKPAVAGSGVNKDTESVSILQVKAVALVAKFPFAKLKITVPNSSPTGLPGFVGSFNMLVYNTEVGIAALPPPRSPAVHPRLEPVVPEFATQPEFAVLTAVPFQHGLKATGPFTLPSPLPRNVMDLTLVAALLLVKLQVPL
jgi:hypothetical protein